MRSKDEDSRTYRISLHPVKYPSTYNVKLGVSKLVLNRTLQQTNIQKRALSFSVSKFQLAARQLENATSAPSATISNNCSYCKFQDFLVKKCPILMFCNNSQQEMAKLNACFKESQRESSFWLSLVLSLALSGSLSGSFSGSFSGSLSFWLSLFLALSGSL